MKMALPSKRCKSWPVSFFGWTNNLLAIEAVLWFFFIPDANLTPIIITFLFYLRNHLPKTFMSDSGIRCRAESLSICSSATTQGFLRLSHPTKTLWLSGHLVAPASWRAKPPPTSRLLCSTPPLIRNCFKTSAGFVISTGRPRWLDKHCRLCSLTFLIWCRRFWWYSRSCRRNKHFLFVRLFYL